MARTSSIIMPSMVGIMGGAPTLDAAASVMFLSVTGIGLRTAQPCRYCFYSPCQILRLSGQKCGNTAPKTVKILNFGHKFTPEGSLVCPIFTKFSDFVRVSRWILIFLIWLLSGDNLDKQPSYKNFPYCTHTF